MADNLGADTAFTVSIVENPDHHRVEARTEQGRLIGFSQYYVRNGALVFFHTEVDPSAEGQGVGSRLAAGVVGYARRCGMPLVPECPFISAYVARHPETHDVVSSGFRMQGVE